MNLDPHPTAPGRSEIYGGFWVGRGSQATLGKQIWGVNYLRRSEGIGT